MTVADNWRQVTSDVERVLDSCNVYAVRCRQGTLFVNAGTGAWLEAIPDRFSPPHVMLLTHYFRDHSAGAAKAARLGMTVFAPAGEEEILVDPVQHFSERPSYVDYENVWETFAPIEPIPVRAARDYETLALLGAEVGVLPLPGVTPNHIGYTLTGPISGQRLAFCGEAIHSPGRMARIAPLQYDYNDLGGAVNAHFSAYELKAGRFDALLPSLGAPILADVDGALDALAANLRRLCAGRPSESALIDAFSEDALVGVSDHVWMAPLNEAVSWYVVSESGKALVIDYGYRGGFGARIPVGGGKYWHWPSRGSRSRRRVLMHGLAPLKQKLGVERIDVALISHFHDDHVAGVPMLQRVFGTQCWAPENFADLLERPDAHRFPCNWPEPLRIDRRLPLAEPFAWEEFEFHLAPMTGHTRFSAAIAFEADGLRFAHTGDQFFFIDRKGGRVEEDWARALVQQNHVYRNGAAIDSFRQTAALMRKWEPDIVLSGHRPPMRTNPAFFALLDAWGDEYADVHRGAMELGEDAAHFGLDSWGGWIWPYRSHVREGAPVSVEVTVRNPLPRDAKLNVRLVGPQGWSGEACVVEAKGRAEARCALSIAPRGPCRRQPIAAELSVDGRLFGQVAEALVTVGGERF